MEDDIPFGTHPVGTPHYKLVANVAVMVQDKRYLGRLLVTTDFYDGPEYQVQLYRGSQYLCSEEEGEEIPRAVSKVPFLQQANRAMYLRREDFEVLDELYVVHCDMYHAASCSFWKV